MASAQIESMAETGKIVPLGNLIGFISVFLTDNAGYDFNGDGVVYFLDGAILASYFLLLQGPSALAQCGTSR